MSALAQRVTVLADEQAQYAVTWEGDREFMAWTALTDGQWTRLLVPVNRFAADRDPMNRDDASIVAVEWWEAGGRDETRDIERSARRVC